MEAGLLRFEKCVALVPELYTLVLEVDDEDVVGVDVLCLEAAYYPLVIVLPLLFIVVPLHHTHVGVIYRQLVLPANDVLKLLGVDTVAHEKQTDGVLPLVCQYEKCMEALIVNDALYFIYIVFFGNVD